MSSDRELLERLGAQIDQMVADGIPDSDEYEKVSDDFHSIQMEMYLDKIIYGDEDI